MCPSVVAAGARSLAVNLPLDQMHAPVLGPANPGDRGGLAAASRNHWSGHAESAHLGGYAFDEQFHTFHSKGKAADPGRSGIAVEARSATQHQQVEGAQPTQGHKKKQKTDKKSGPSGFDPSLPFVLQSRQPWAGKEPAAIEVTEEQRAMIETLKGEKAEKAAVEGKSEHTVFHGAEEKDYQGTNIICG